MSTIVRKGRKELDAKWIYLFVLFALAAPLFFKLELDPAQMTAAEDTYAEIDKLERMPGKLAVVAADWGPGTSAENGPQTELAIEHLMRKRIPFAIVSLYYLAPPMMKELPLKVAERLKAESAKKRAATGSAEAPETWEYGKDWVNFGYQVNGALSLQSIAKASDIQEVLRSDAFGTPLAEIPVTKDFHTLPDVQLLIHVTGLVNVFNYWLQFFRTEGYSPPLLHGCTSISIPDAYLYYSSKQVKGFFEGVAGAAWYDKLLSKKYPGREEVAQRVNTGLGFAQLVILALIAVGNGVYFYSKRSV